MAEKLNDGAGVNAAAGQPSVVRTEDGLLKFNGKLAEHIVSRGWPYLSCGDGSIVTESIDGIRRDALVYCLENGYKMPIKLIVFTSDVLT